MAEFEYTPSKLMLPTSYYDKNLADFAVDFITGDDTALTHTVAEWAGKRFTLMGWQEQIVRDIFGIVDKKTGYRQFRMAYVEISKKNGKSELAAAIALYLLFGDLEPGAEVYSCAADVNQASIVFNTAVAMVKNSPSLAPLAKLVTSSKRINFPTLNSFYRVLSAETKAKQGFNVSGLVFDELQAQQNRKLFDTMTKFTGDARRQPLYFLITTAGSDKNSICYEIHQKARGILDGTKYDPAFYPVIFGMDEGDDWADPKVWLKCNPSIGVTLQFEDVQAAYEQARQYAGDEIHFRQFRLNEWCNADVRWMRMDKWDACGEDFDISDFEGRECYCGLDLATTVDLTAAVLVFPPKGSDEKFTVIPYFWLPEERVDYRTRQDHVPYAIWKKQGVFHTTEGEVVDFDFVTAFITKLSERFKIKEIAYDRHGAEKMRQELEEIGAERGFTVFPMGLGYYSMSPPMKDLMQFALEGKLRHGKHPVMDWNMKNLVAETDAAGNIKPSKRKSTEKIDGVVALLMGLARAMLANETTSVYDQRGVIFI